MCTDGEREKTTQSWTFPWMFSEYSRNARITSLTWKGTCTLNARTDWGAKGCITSLCRSILLFFRCPKWGKNGRKMEFGPTEKMGETWRKMSKTGFSTDLPIFGPFFSHFPGGSGPFSALAGLPENSPLAADWNANKRHGKHNPQSRHLRRAGRGMGRCLLLVCFLVSPGACHSSSVLFKPGIAKPLVKTRSLVTGALVPPLGCFRAPWVGGKGAATNLRFKNTGKTSTKWISVSDFAVRPRSGCKNVAETCAPSPDTNLRLTNLRLGNAWSNRRMFLRLWSVTFSSRPNLSPTWVIYMATRRLAHNTPIHMDLVPFYREPYNKSMWIGVLWASLRAATWITHVGGKFRHGLLEKSLMWGKLMRAQEGRKLVCSRFHRFCLQSIEVLRLAFRCKHKSCDCEQQNPIRTDCKQKHYHRTQASSRNQLYTKRIDCKQESLIDITKLHQKKLTKNLVRLKLFSKRTFEYISSTTSEIDELKAAIAFDHV